MLRKKKSKKIVLFNRTDNKKKPPFSPITLPSAPAPHLTPSSLSIVLLPSLSQSLPRTRPTPPLFPTHPPPPFLLSTVLPLKPTPRTDYLAVSTCPMLRGTVYRSSWQPTFPLFLPAPLAPPHPHPPITPPPPLPPSFCPRKKWQTSNAAKKEKNSNNNQTNKGISYYNGAKKKKKKKSSPKSATHTPVYPSFSLPSPLSVSVPKKSRYPSLVYLRPSSLPPSRRRAETPKK